MIPGATTVQNTASPEVFGRSLSDRLLPGLIRVLVVALVLYPIGWLVYGSVRSGAPFESGTLTLANYVKAYADPQIGRVVANTLVFAFGQACGALAIGTTLAWIIVRTNTPGRRIFESLTLVLFLFPLIMAVFAWTMLLSPQRGLFNIVLMEIFGLASAPFDIYTMGGMIFVQSLYVAPIAFLIVAPAMASVDGNLEEAARMSGAGPWMVARRVSLPLVLPALSSAFLLLFIVGIESFDIPQMLGAQKGIFTYPTLIYHAIAVRFPADYGLGTALAMGLLAVTAVAVLVYRRIMARSERFETIRGKGFRTREIDLGHWRFAAAGLCWAFFVVTVFLPLLIIVLGSLLRFFGRFSWAMFSRLTFENYVRLFEHPAIGKAVVNSLLLAVFAGLSCVLLAALVGHLTVKSKTVAASLLEGVAMLPIAFPATVLGVGMLWAWIVVPLPIYGTILILAIAYVTRYLPLALRTVSGGFAQVSSEMDEAAHLSGAGWGMTLRRITLPLLKPALSAAWLMLFMIFIRELGMSVLLVGTGNPVLSVVMFDYYQSGELGLLAACSVFLIVLILATTMAARRWFGVRFSQFGVG